MISGDLRRSSAGSPRRPATTTRCWRRCRRRPYSARSSAPPCCRCTRTSIGPTSAGINIEHHGDRLASGRRHVVEVSRLREDAPKRGNRYRPPLARLHDFDAMSQGGHVRFHGSTILPASARMPRASRRRELCCERGRLRTAVLSGTCANCPRGRWDEIPKSQVTASPWHPLATAFSEFGDRSRPRPMLACTNSRRSKPILGSSGAVELG